MIQSIQEAATILQKGGLVVVPTETVYGLAANALDEGAVANIFKLKGRPFFDPLIVHIASPEQLAWIARKPHGKLQKLMAAFWPGPLTVLLTKRSTLPDVVTSGLSTVAVRMPSHPLARKLIQLSGLPLAAPSANRFGRISPTSAGDVREEFGKRTPFLLDGGPCRHGLESTIVRIHRGRIQIVRQGAISQEQLETVLGEAVLERKKLLSSHPEAPGLLKSHYAPRTPLQLCREGHWVQPIPARAVVLAFRKMPVGFQGKGMILSRKGSLPEAARTLYSKLRKLDSENARLILAELLPEQGLGRAINDRLRRASAESAAKAQPLR